MNDFEALKLQSVFKYFEEISAVPRGSGDMDKISLYCVNFAKQNGLIYIVDDAKNVVIFKDASKGYEKKEPVILQGHLDMVCQKEENKDIDFEKDGIEIIKDGDFLKANGTTLGADNGIAVAMILAILEDDTISHPPIEAVFTTDEEIGMIGASKLDVSALKSKRMINLDAEEGDTVTVSCAGGSDIKVSLPVSRKNVNGTKVCVSVKGLKGGHSGVEIDKGRVNASQLMGRILNHIKELDFDIISVNGGTKANAIPVSCTLELVAQNEEKLVDALHGYFSIIKEELKDREKNIILEVNVENSGNFDVFDKTAREKLCYMLLTVPNGVIDMSKSIDGLVETSLNLGILETKTDSVLFHHALRSNKKTALDFLEDKMMYFAQYNGAIAKKSGRYEPWEYRENSKLREIY
ncbi:MAG: beta-Ala-His dipeptidase, partial [Clostridia bacterium]|nr:beta-Ala-His dipeptidase [Clostridia bacterium]